VLTADECFLSADKYLLAHHSMLCGLLAVGWRCETHSKESSAGTCLKISADAKNQLLIQILSF
jgi:hypothetical protein